MRSLGFLAVALLAGCVGADNARRNDTLVRRASFDLGCPEKRIKTTTLNTVGGAEIEKGAAGCGRRATYRFESGQWVQNANDGVTSDPQMTSSDASGAPSASKEQP